MKLRKTKPLFDPVVINSSDYLLERRKKIAKLQLQKTVDDMEVNLIKSFKSEKLFIKKQFNGFRRQFRKILKHL